MAKAKASCDGTESKAVDPIEALLDTISQAAAEGLIERYVMGRGEQAIPTIKNVIRASREYSDEVVVKLLDVVAAAQDVRAMAGQLGNEADSMTTQLLSIAARVREQLIASYMPVVDRIAMNVWRSRSYVDRDELLQTGFLELVKAIDRAARLEEKRSIGAYVVRSVAGPIKAEALFHSLKIRLREDHRKEFVQFWRAAKQLEQDGREPTLEKIAAHLCVPKESVMDWYRLGRGLTVSLDAMGVSPDETEQYIWKERAAGKASAEANEEGIVVDFVIFERAFDLMPPLLRKVLELRYGVNRDGALSRKDMAGELRISHNSAGSYLTRAHTELERLMLGLQDRSLDLADLCARYPDRRSVLVFFAHLGLPIGEKDRLYELRVAALKIVEDSPLSYLQKSRIVKLYGLSGGQRKDALTIAAEENVTREAIYIAERRGFKVLERYVQSLSNRT